MKKWIALLLALLMLVSLCACGEKEPEASLSNKAQSQTEKPAEEPAEEPEPAAEPEPEPEPEPDASLTTLETNLFTVSYPEEDGWVYDEADLTDREDYSIFEMYLLDSEENKEADIRIYASVESAYSYRETLYDEGFDEYAFVMENAYADRKTTIGGQELIRSIDRDNFYFGRDEASGTTLGITIYVGADDERVARVLENIEFHLTDTGNVDGPWFWDGTPFFREDASVLCGTVTVNSEFLPISESIVTHEVFDHDVAAVGDTVYLLVEGTLKAYDYDGESLTYREDVALDDEFERADSTDDGTVILSDFMAPCTGLKDGAVVFSYTGTDYFASAPDGTWGISYFTAPDDVTRCTFAGGAMQTEPFPVTGLSMATGIWIDESRVFITGQSEEDSAQVLQVYDHSGALQTTLLGEDGRLGSITFAAKCASGYIALDGNMRTVVLWNENGDYVGEIDTDDLFGASYPWLCSADMLPDGSLLVVLTEDRDDDSAMELVAFRLTGF